MTATGLTALAKMLLSQCKQICVCICIRPLRCPRRQLQMRPCWEQAAMLSSMTESHAGALLLYALKSQEQLLLLTH